MKREKCNRCRGTGQRHGTICGQCCGAGFLDIREKADTLALWDKDIAEANTFISQLEAMPQGMSERERNKSLKFWQKKLVELQSSRAAEAAK